MFLKYTIIQELITKNKTINPKKNKGFSLVELVIVIAILAILSVVAIPSFFGIMEWVETVIAMYNLNNAYKECQINLSLNKTNSNTITYTIPDNTSRFQYPDSGDDGVCLSPDTGNILTAARAAYGQTVSTFNLNINVKTGEKSTERAVPTWVNWEN
tara:strand:+ start:584 stop:1054 length:471 start_codon:yes stop_codon:yes gene_type:complete